MEIDPLLSESKMAWSSSSERKNPTLLSLFLDLYKSTRCPSCVDDEKCPFYHSPSDYRRPFSKFKYSKEICHGKCQPWNCNHSLNSIEANFHVKSYKTKYCKSFVMNRSCSANEYCPHAHSDLELKIRPLHLMTIDLNFLFFSFKSEFCPYSWVKHLGFTCPYAHNWQDFKRPYFHGQIAQSCPKWKTRKHIHDYQEYCVDGFNCKFCHGWKELEFHPARFKKTKCNKCLVTFSKEEATKMTALPEMTEINHLIINGYICSFKHSWEKDLNLEFDYFDITPKNLGYAKYNKSDFFSLVFDVDSASVQPKSNKSIKKSIKIVDFLCFEQKTLKVTSEKETMECSKDLSSAKTKAQTDNIDSLVSFLAKPATWKLDGVSSHHGTNGSASAHFTLLSKDKFSYEVLDSSGEIAHKSKKNRRETVCVVGKKSAMSDQNLPSTFCHSLLRTELSTTEVSRSMNKIQMIQEDSSSSSNC